MKRTVTVLLSVLTISALLFAGCTRETEPKTVETIINTNEKVSEAVNAVAKDTGVDLLIEGNTITYTYDISKVDGITEEMMDDEEFIDSLKTTLKSHEEILANTCKTIEDEAEIEGVQAVARLTYGDKSVVDITVTSDSLETEETSETEGTQS